MASYDLIVIGSGTVAQVAAGRVRAAGWSVAVIDHRPLGGACALRGCDPKKMLVSGEEPIDAARRMAGHGVTGDLAIDWSALMAFKRSFTDPIPAKQVRHYAELGVDVLQGIARFVAPDRIEVDGRTLQAGHALLATGARPISLGIPGEVLVAIRHELTAANLRSTMFAYPTGASDLGYMLRGSALDRLVCRVFAQPGG